MPCRAAAALAATLSAAARAPPGWCARLFLTSRHISSQPASSSSDPDAVTLTPAAVDRIRELLAHPPPSSPPSPTALRLTVEAGGCSGFSYGFALDGGPPQPGDRRFGHDGAAIVVDGVSLDLVKGATIDHVSELIREAFEVVDNPNAGGGCGCGSSFTPKF